MNLLGIIYAIIAAVIYGLVYTLDQKILMKTQPLGLMFVSAILSIIVLAPFVFLDWGSIKTTLESGKLNIFLIVLTVILAIVATLLSLLSIRLIGASATATFEISYPFFVVIFSFLLLKSGVNPQFLIGALFIFIGSFIIIRFN